MKKIISVSILTIVLFASSVSAATFILTPARINTSNGQEFSLNVSVNPQGTKDYTAKIELEYPSSLLEVKSFSLNSSWIALSQKGYDLVDNTSGKLIKTGGYPGGFSSTAFFGTVTFKAKKVGTAYVKASGNSVIYDSTNKNVFSGLPTAVVGISATKINPVLPVVPGEDGIITTEQPSNVAPETVESAPIGQTSASVLNTIISYGRQNIYIGVITAFFGILLIVYGVKTSRRKKNK